jgi:hypothetical protein
VGMSPLLKKLIVVILKETLYHCRKIPYGGVSYFFSTVASLSVE